MTNINKIIEITPREAVRRAAATRSEGNVQLKLPTKFSSSYAEGIVDAVRAKDRMFLDSMNLDKYGCHIAAIRLNGNKRDLFAQEWSSFGWNSYGTVWFRWNSVPEVSAVSLIPEDAVSVTWIPSSHPQASEDPYYVYAIPATGKVDPPGMVAIILDVGHPRCCTKAEARTIWQWFIENDGVVIDSDQFGKQPFSLADPAVCIIEVPPRTV